LIKELSSVWALLLGVVLIMLGNGMHSTLMGLRGDLEGFGAAELAVITSAYFLGFLSGARTGPTLIQRVGHVRVFAALGSFVSAALLAFPLVTEFWAWTLLRFVIGFSMSGVFVAAESWLNDSATNENRGQILGAYMIAQTLGIISAQGVLSLGDAATATLFIVSSIFVSISFAPILLTVSRVPASEAAKPMTLRRLVANSPLGTVGVFLLGGVYATQAGMGAVFGTQIGLSADTTALFIAMLFAGAMVLQVPLSWLSDHMGRRLLICATAALGAGFSLLGWFSEDRLSFLLLAAFFSGGLTTPLYALLLAYTNDHLDVEDMPAASGGLVFVFGLGAIAGPLITGATMQAFGPYAFWVNTGVTLGGIAVYGVFRMTQRPEVPVDETESYVSILPTASAETVETAGVWAAEHGDDETLEASGG